MLERSFKEAKLLHEIIDDKTSHSVIFLTSSDTNIHNIE